MSRDVPTTRYFAVGFFTAQQLEAKHRALLALAAEKAPVPEIQSATQFVAITVFGVDTGTETVELGVTKVCTVVQDPQVQASGASFSIERFDSTQFPGALSPQDAFTQYLASTAGIATFGNATAVQLFAINVDAVPDST
jgi:hypothetical protein